MIQILQQLFVAARRGCLALILPLALFPVGGCATSTSGPGEANNSPPPGSVLPQPTERLLDQTEGEEWQRQRRTWIESLHRAAPGTDWRALERRNWNAHLETRNQLLVGETRTGAAVVDGWTEVGSDNQAGRTHQVAYDETADTLYLGSNLGGVWRGHFDADNPDPNQMNWQPIGDGVYGSSMQVLRLDGPPEVLLKTWGDGWSGELHRSVDNGTTWQVVSGIAGRPRRLIATGDPAETVFLIADDPNHWNGPAYTRLYRSQDLGATFDSIFFLDNFKGDIWTPRTGNGSLYLLVDHQLRVSTDLGDTWSVVGSLPTSSYGGAVNFSLTGSEAGAPAFYSVMNTTGGPSVALLLRSLDGGVTWEEMGDVTDFWGDLTSLAASTIDPDLVLYGGVEVHRSTNGGASFTVINDWGAYYADPAGKLHADIPSIDFIPLSGGGEILFISTDGGTYYSADGGATVHNLSLAGLRVSQYYSILTDTAVPTRIMAGSQDQGYQLGERDTGSFDQLLSGDYGHLTSSDGTHDLVYSVYPGFVLIAEDDGSGTPRLIWPIDFPAGESHDWLPAVVADPLDRNSFFFCAAHIYEYNRSGNSWIPTQLPHDFALIPGEYVSALAIAPSDLNRWYAATNRGQVWFSSDAGQSWTPSTISGPPGSPWLTGFAISVDPHDPFTVVVAGSGYSNPAAFKSTNGGVDFTAIADGLPPTTIYALAAHPGGGQDLFAATQAGPYRYDNDSGTWASVLDLTAPMTTYWDVETLSDRVRFATYGRGIWDYLMHELSVATTGTGTGTVTSSPAGIDCGDDCAQIFDWGTVVELVAEPDSGSVFSHWEGDSDCTDGDSQVTMSDDIACTAVFDYTGQIFFDGFESGNVSLWFRSTGGR